MAAVASEAWLLQVKKCVDDGIEVGNTLELLSSSLSFDMKYPIVLQKWRKLSYPFMFTEALYIITGRSDVRILEQHVPKFEQYSDLYPFQQGSYGPPFIEQLRYVVDTLIENEDSRQAVMSIWRPNPRKSVDIPCTLSLQFLIRGDKLHTVVSMRSSDVFTGLAYDMFCFSAMSAVVLAMLDMEDLKLGNCYINAGSSHLYTRDMPRISGFDVDHRVYNVDETRYPSTYAGICLWLEELAAGRLSYADHG